jgi:hypothetical protein
MLEKSDNIELKYKVETQRMLIFNIVLIPTTFNIVLYNIH